MKKRGFTLIELLAVIIILAIIALIATPIVMRVIENSKKAAAERSAENYIKELETMIVAERVNSDTIEDGLYTLDSNGDICLDQECTKKLEVTMKGTKPISGGIEIENEKITGYMLTVGEYEKTYGTLGIKVTKATSTTKTTGNVPTTGQYNPGDEYIINIGGQDRIFFVLGVNSEDSNKVDLIMNQNIGNTVAWCGDEVLCKTNGQWDNTKGPITATTYLKSQTSSWEVTPTLPIKQQILEAYAGSMPMWLTDYTKDTQNYLKDNPVSGVSGYWTASTYDPSYAWIVGNNGSGVGGTVSIAWINACWSHGVRPVVTLYKLLLD